MQQRRKDEDVLQAKKLFSKAVFNIDEDACFFDREQFRTVIARTLQIQPSSVEICTVTPDPCTVTASMIGFNCAQRLVRLHKGGDTVSLSGREGEEERDEEREEGLGVEVERERGREDRNV